MKMNMLFPLVCALAVGASAQSVTVLDQAKIQQLEITLAQNPGDRQAQTLLGQNYAFVILGITSVGKYDRVAGVDPAKARGDFAEHARDALLHTSWGGVAGEGGYALWRYCTEVDVFQTLKHLPDRVPLRDERLLAIEALDLAVLLEPENGQWRSYRIPILAYRSSQGNSATLSVADAYDQARKDMAALKGSQRFYMLATMAKLALTASAWNDARRYAQELLDAADDPRDWNFGTAIFYGNMVLGQVALHDGDRTAARTHLLASGKTRGSPQLNSFGPNMSLAKDLLELGETDAVLSFFNLCGIFWKNDHGALARWKAAVAAGRIPDFGANLVY
jgi:hypothetical protein